MKQKASPILGNNGNLIYDIFLSYNQHIRKIIAKNFISGAGQYNSSHTIIQDTVSFGIKGGTMKKMKQCIALILMGMFLVVCLAPAQASEQKININTATKAQLITLKYVGEKLAEKIIDHRKETPFKTPEDLMKVKGIGPKVLEANKDKITT